MLVPDVSFSHALLKWYDAHQRSFPWRSKTTPAYHTWLSEIMLQQTTTLTVIPYFLDFIEKWPMVEDLARAPLEDILHAWQGLGYYARARNLHKCAQAVCDIHDGHFPTDPKALLKLPGIGPYTAHAIAAIAFNQPVAPVDGNIKRVISRLFALKDVKAVDAYAGSLVPPGRPGDFAQAMMDLGAGICTPRQPACDVCPWSSRCLALREGDPTYYPILPEKKPKPTKFAFAFWLENPEGAVFIRRRPESGLLGGMTEIPSTPWEAETWTPESAALHAPLKADWARLEGSISHTFTHFHLKVQVLKGRTLSSSTDALSTNMWCLPERFSQHPFPTLMKKIIRHAQGASKEAF